MQVNVVGVKFKNSNHVYSFSPNSIELKKGDYVIVETEKGNELGVIVKEEYKIEASDLVSPLKDVVRKSSLEEVKKAEEYDKVAESLAPEIIKIIKESKLEMKVIKVEANYDNSKLLINYVSEDRVDFRELVKTLADKFKKRIELRQIGSRDEVRMLGGFGPCGKICCCCQNMAEFDHVAIKMAKNQNLSLNPTNISGLCGKLMCCLAYENSNYAEALKVMPKVNSQVKTAQGNGTVVYNDLLNRKVTVRFQNGDSSELQDFALEDVKFEKKSN